MPKGEKMIDNKIDRADRVKGKNVHGKVVVLTRSKPEQLTLFQTFLPEEDEKYSNTIELYDAIPKYFTNARAMAALREVGRYLPILDREFKYRDEVYKVQIHPARIRDKDKREKEFYPSQREELVEEALRKIACDHPNGVYLDDQAGVQFTLYELRQELVARGHAINVPDLIESLKICNLATIGMQTADGTGVMQASIFPVLLIVSKEEWLKQPKQARCYVQFNPLVTASINRLTYRQFDYLTYMSYKHRLSRWLHKRLSHNYTQAGILHPYTIRMSTILRDSGLPEKERGHDNTREIDKTLEELQDKRVLMTVDKEILRGARRKIVDVKYTLRPDLDFVDEARKANIRAIRLLKTLTAPQVLLMPPTNLAD
jgi:hypothetical protein